MDYLEQININRKKNGLKKITGVKNASDLELMGYTNIATYKQWQKLGYQVKKGSKSLTLKGATFKYNKKTKERELNGFFKFNVFDITQCEKIEN